MEQTLPIPQQLNRSVPRGSLLGTFFFTIYTQPLEEIIRKHGIKYDLYAYDTQLYLTFVHDNPMAKQSTINTMESALMQ